MAMAPQTSQKRSADDAGLLEMGCEKVLRRFAVKREEVRTRRKTGLCDTYTAMRPWRMRQSALLGRGGTRGY